MVYKEKKNCDFIINVLIPSSGKTLRKNVEKTSYNFFFFSIKSQSKIIIAREYPDKRFEK